MDQLIEHAPFILAALAPGVILWPVAALGGWRRARNTGLVFMAILVPAGIAFQSISDNAGGWDRLAPGIAALACLGLILATAVWLGVIGLIFAKRGDPDR